MSRNSYPKIQDQSFLVKHIQKIYQTYYNKEVNI